MENIKKSALPNKEKKKKPRSAGEVGIKILAETGTSLLRKSSDPPLVLATTVVNNKMKLENSMSRNVDITSALLCPQVVGSNTGSVTEEQQKKVSSFVHQPICFYSGCYLTINCLYFYL